MDGDIYTKNHSTNFIDRVEFNKRNDLISRYFLKIDCNWSAILQHVYELNLPGN